MDDPMKLMNAEARARWDEKATFWDRLHGQEGNGFHRTIVEPTVQRLLQLAPGERVVDAACGNGTMARRLAAWGAEVTAFDFSLELVELARVRGSSGESAIDYRVIDATDERAVVELGEGTFDAAVCTMALMDMPTVEPLYRAIHRLLRPGGRFVFVTGHPVFDTANPVRITEQRDDAGELRRCHALRIERYLDVPPTRAVGARGEPTPHDLHHRPLSQLLGDAFAAGFVLEAIEEPSFPASTDDFWQFPPALAGRLRAQGQVIG
jgi:SAM-dependent methyltransferase